MGCIPVPVGPCISDYSIVILKLLASQPFCDPKNYWDLQRAFDCIDYLSTCFLYLKLNIKIKNTKIDYIFLIFEIKTKNMYKINTKVDYNCQSEQWGLHTSHSV